MFLILYIVQKTSCKKYIMLKIGELMCCEVTDKKEQLFDFLSVNCVKNNSTKK